MIDKDNKKILEQLWEIIEKISGWFLRLFFRILKKEPTEKDFKFFMQFVKFGIVGVSNTLLAYLLYVGSLFGLRRLGIFPKGDYFLAQLIAFILSVLWSFYWNNKKVFIREKRGKKDTWKALLKTYVSYSFTGLFLNTILLFLWVQVLHLSEFLAPIINLFISVPVNFLINKFWAFK